MDKRKIVRMLLEAEDSAMKAYNEFSSRKNFTVSNVYNGIKIELSICPENCREDEDFEEVPVICDISPKISKTIIEIIGMKITLENEEKYNDLVCFGSEMNMGERLDALFALSEEEDANERI